MSWRTIVPRRVLDNPAAADYCRRLHEAGDRHRVTDETIQQMVILDRSVAFVPTVPNTDGVGALIIRQAGVVATLVDLFEWAWGQASDLDTAGPPVPSPQQRQILRLMTTMVKDEVAARELGIGVRTYRRHVAALLTKLQVANRVQAAVIAKQHGWV